MSLILIDKKCLSQIGKVFILKAAELRLYWKHQQSYQLPNGIGIGTIRYYQTCQDITGPIPSVFLDKYCKDVDYLIDKQQYK
jgi:hypothetical protein